MRLGTVADLQDLFDVSYVTRRNICIINFASLQTSDLLQQTICIHFARGKLTCENIHKCIHHEYLLFVHLAPEPLHCGAVTRRGWWSWWWSCWPGWWAPPGASPLSHCSWCCPCHGYSPQCTPHWTDSPAWRRQGGIHRPAPGSSCCHGPACCWRARSAWAGGGPLCCRAGSRSGCTGSGCHSRSWLSGQGLKKENHILRFFIVQWWGKNKVFLSQCDNMTHRGGGRLWFSVTVLHRSGRDNFASCSLSYNCVGNRPEFIQLSKLQTCQMSKLFPSPPQHFTRQGHLAGIFWQPV